jgi:hypothetical protein
LRVIASLYERWRHLVHELAKFGIVGFRFTTYRRFVFVSHERAAARSLHPAGSRTGASS